ncbi:DUF5417 domain-containing protein [Citrobacter phage Moon]|uniref:Phage protein n=1 Tax=Citrobacter phage Moon TaxID=1540095 RepID=A0A0A0YQG6_9CAUD|nr:DUF5417 domain-containing protein [Citrobacter phage Moon]AIX12231.1 hypothetical protein CPT_Moon260 [Citrobacter phage Moon]
MKLQRQSIKLGSGYRGKWNFCILDNNPEEIERVEEILCGMDTGFSVGGEAKTWNDYCDNCPCYEDGFGSGFWIDVEDVPAFKAAFKLAKAKNNG